MRKPPSTVIKEKFESLECYPPSESVCLEIAKEVLLPVGEVQMWLDHLHTIKQNRKRGAAKAAETRRRKKKSNSSNVLVNSEHDNGDKTYCGVCHQEYQNFTEDVEEWIECDMCDR